MLSNLHTQLHFVRAIQAVDTTGVEPLRAIRDETVEGMNEQRISLETLKGILDKEELAGFRRRPRRLRNGEAGDGMADEGREEEKLVEAVTRERRERGYYLVHKGNAKGAE